MYTLLLVLAAEITSNKIPIFRGLKRYKSPFGFSVCEIPLQSFLEPRVESEVNYRTELSPVGIKAGQGRNTGQLG